MLTVPAGLSDRCVGGFTIGGLSDTIMRAVLQNPHVIRRVYKICLLTATYRLCDIKAGCGGSGVARSAASTKSWLGGETRKRPATLWSCGLPFGPRCRGPLGPECEPAEAPFGMRKAPLVGGRGVRRRAAWYLAVSSWLNPDLLSSGFFFLQGTFHFVIHI